MADVLSFSPIWCDVGKNLGTAYLVIGLKDCLERKLPFREKLRMIVNVRSQHVIFESFVNLDDAQENLTNQHVVLFPVDVSLVPKSCSSLAVCGGSELRMKLSFTLRLEDSQEELFRRRLREELNGLKSGRHSVCCRMCGSFILPPKIHFKRVLELPSDNWLEFCQDWCCHGSSHMTSFTEGLQPCMGDCLVGDQYITLHPSDLEPGNVCLVSGIENNFVKCSRCRGTLGGVTTADPNGMELGLTNLVEVCLYKHKISLKGSELFRCYSTEQFFSCLLLSKSRGAVNFKFLVQYPIKNSRRETCAFLWLFNADAAIVTNVEFRNNSSGGKTSICNKAKYLRVLKLLYKLTPRNNKSNWFDEVDSWEQNPSVEPLVFAQETCLHLILLLAKSTNLVPQSMREMNGFKFPTDASPVPYETIPTIHGCWVFENHERLTED